MSDLSRAIVPAPADALALSSAETNPTAVYLAGRAEASRRTLLSGLDHIAAYFDQNAFSMGWHTLSYGQVQAIRSRLADEYAPSTANQYLSALRGVIDSCWRLGYIDAENRAKLRDVANVRGYREKKGRHVEANEIRALLRTCLAGDRTIALRDAAIIALLYTTGLRRAEAVAATLANYTPETGALQIIGKRNKQRTVFIMNQTATLIDAWIAVRGNTPGKLFVAVRKDGQISARGITPQRLYQILLERSAAAGIDKIDPHDMRRTMIGNLWDQGVDGSLIAQIAGHEDVKTTMGYDRRKIERRRDAAALLDLPDLTEMRMK